MYPHSLLFLDPPDLSDEAASEMLDFLYQVTAAFESQYIEQIKRHYYEMAEKGEQPQPDLFEVPGHESPPF
jgi:hypothetical protein